ncbi:hypothetical protein [Bacteroides sp. UBA939]|uniref:hypothetical protein n=1 Tax=Bacteroides sp. UBA939 TaxID=1946092 RepID=UPI0025BD9DF6|nr:hypothetical protein [Bacteroides sp. UBA939]
MKIRCVIYMLIAVLFASCEDENQNQDMPSQAMVSVAVSVALPQPEPVNTYTRADNPYADTDILNVDMLVFNADDNKFMERIKVESNKLQVTSTGIDFTVRMNAVSHDRIVHLVVNGRTADGLTDRLNFDDIDEDMLESVAIPLLKTTPLATGTMINHAMPLVMWGRFNLETGLASISGVKLLRTAACIQVKKGTGTATNGLDRFVIREISTHRGVAQGFLTPASYTSSVTATPTVGNPVTVANESDYLTNTQQGWITHNANDNLSSLYVYERNCTDADYMSVIIKAGYQVGTTTKDGYYKVVMVDANGVPLNIIRNHRYKITIVAVNGPGYADVQDAIDSAPSNNLKVDVEDEDPGYTCITADGEHYMAVSNNEFHLYGGTSGTTSGVEICTVYSSRNVTPTFVENSDWLNVTAVSLGGGKYQILGDFNQTPASTTLTVLCDNLTMDIGVNWIYSVSSVSGYASDGDSYVFDLINSGDVGWNVRILENPNWFALHPSAGSPGAYPGAGMQSELSSKFHPHAYLHVGTGTGRRGALLKNSVVSGNVKVDRIVIVQ